jgi:hypothetical protein
MVTPSQRISVEAYFLRNGSLSYPVGNLELSTVLPDHFIYKYKLVRALEIGIPNCHCVAGRVKKFCG